MAKQKALTGSELSTSMTEPTEQESEESEAGNGDYALEIQKSLENNEVSKWVPQEWECVRTLQEAVRNYGRVDMMRCRQRQWGYIAVKRMPAKWVTSGPQEFAATYPKSTERPWFDIGILRYLTSQRFPYVVTLHGVFHDDECACVVMSLHAGDLFTWGDRLDCQGAEREAAVRPVARQACSAVCWLHNLGISHRDLSLENILIDKCDVGGPQIKLIDFGMGTLNRWVTKEVRGKQSYQAPEQHSDGSVDTFMSDGFALGVILFCLVAQDYPWQSTQVGQCQLFAFVSMRGMKAFFHRRKHRKCNGAHLAQVLSEPLMDLLDTMLNFNPSHRLTLGECCWCGGAQETRKTVWDMAWFDEWP